MVFCTLLHIWYIGKYISLDQCPFSPRFLWHHLYYGSHSSTCLEQLAEAFITHHILSVHFWIDGILASISYWIGVRLCRSCYGIIYTIVVTHPSSWNSSPKHFTHIQMHYRPVINWTAILGPSARQGQHLIGQSVMNRTIIVGPPARQGLGMIGQSVINWTDILGPLARQGQFLIGQSVMH
jgi:hypothetical protein